MYENLLMDWVRETVDQLRVIVQTLRKAVFFFNIKVLKTASKYANTVQGSIKSIAKQKTAVTAYIYSNSFCSSLFMPLNVKARNICDP